MTHLRKKTLIVIVLFFLFGTRLNAGEVSTGSTAIQDSPSDTKEEYNPKAMNVVTVPPYNMKEKKLADNDAALDAFEKTIAVKLSEVYKSTIPGGEAVFLAANQLGIKQEVEAAFKTIIQVAIDKQSTDLSAAKGIIDKLAEKLGVETFAFPVGAGGMKELKDKKSVTFYVVLYDVKTGAIINTSQTKVELPSMLFLGFGKSNDKIEKAAILKSTDAAGDIISKIKKTL